MNLLLVIGVLYIFFIASAILIFNFTQKYGFWTEQYVQLPHRVIPWFGNVYRIFTRKDSLWNYCRTLYLKAAKKSLTVYGFYFVTRPALLLRDETVVMQIMGSHAQYFDVFQPPKDRLLSMCPLFLKGNESFSIFKASRLYAALDMAMECLLIFTVEIDNEIDNNPNKMVEVNLWDRLARAAGMIMTIVGFGKNLFVDDENKPITCDLLVGEIFKEHKVSRKQILADLIDPRSRKIFRRKIVPASLEKRFMEALSHYRNSHNRKISYSFLDWVDKEAAKKEQYLDDDEVAPYVFGFFVEVYISIVVVGSFVLLNFAHQPDVQTMARSKHPEYQFTKEKILDYENKVPMDFLDATVAETMRLYPVTGLITRKCNIDRFQLFDSKAKKINLRADSIICISKFGFHTDPRFWKHPFRFFPDRFTSRNRRPHTYCYYPFEGLHWSMAKDFNRLTLKCFMVMFLNRYDIKPSRKTPPYPKLKNNTIITTPEDGVYVELHPRPRRDNIIVGSCRDYQRIVR